MFSQKELFPPHSFDAALLTLLLSRAAVSVCYGLLVLSSTSHFPASKLFCPARWHRPPCFNDMTLTLTLPQMLRQEVHSLLVKGMIKRLPQRKLESGVYSLNFVVPKINGVHCVILDLRPIHQLDCICRSEWYILPYSYCDAPKMLPEILIRGHICIDAKLSPREWTV